ncbi:MAG TPA: HDIG domain-containing protein [Thermoleophilaceae bacterium]|nr:HDIG domain-containing protein [Thermoleophilaceae bacterium]
MTGAPLVDRLFAAAPVRALRDGLAAAGIEAWLVGGVVRDALLGRALSDIDLAVAGDAEVAARAASKALGGPRFPLSEEFGAWRTLSQARDVSCDVSPLQGETIEQDLAKRDFALNAVAVPLSGGDPIDPFGGIADAEAGLLRVLGERAYADDPLRALRLARLAAELGMAPDAETERLTAAVAARLTEPSGERVFGELSRLLTAPGALDGLELARRLGLLAAVLPEVAALQGVEQSHYHHRDVYGHTVEVLEQQIELLRPGRLEQLFGDRGEELRAVLEEPLADDLTRGEALRLGALFHDVAKPQTRGVRDDGRVTFIGHDAAGQELVGEVFRRLRTSERLRSHVGALTRHHLALGFLVHERPLDSAKVYGYLSRCDPVAVDVSVLSCADRLATRGRNAERAIAAHLDVARELIGPALRWHAEGRPRPPLRGDELAAAVGIEPGPELGRLLARLSEAAYTGEATTRDQAVALARELLAAGW